MSGVELGSDLATLSISHAQLKTDRLYCVQVNRRLSDYNVIPNRLRISRK